MASVTVAFNDKLVADHLDVAAHFDAKIVAEIDVASAAADVKHAAELASALDGYEKIVDGTTRVC